MATAILVGLALLATALDRNGLIVGPGNTGVAKLLAMVFLVAFCVAIWTDIARAFK